MAKKSEFSKLSKEKRLERRKQAYKIYFLCNSVEKASYNLKSIARDVGMSLEEVKYYKEKDKWEERLKRDLKNGKMKKKIQKEFKHMKEKYEIEQSAMSEVEMIENIFDKYKINDRYRLFILYYLQTYNAKMSAIKAGYSKDTAVYIANGILGKKPVKAALSDIKKIIHKNIYIDAYDILSEYIKIAFADITDFIEFQYEDGKNKIKLKSSDAIDGRLINEVKSGRDGLSIKLVDKMKALEKLERFFELMPDRRLEIERAKLELQQKLASKADEEDSSVVIVNDIG